MSRNLGNADDAASATPPSTLALSSLRKAVLLAAFCLAQFIDVFNVSSLLSALPSLSSDLHIEPSESIWALSAFQLTFAAFLLASGKLSDVFSAKYTFVIGLTMLSILSLITGFMHNKIALFVLRALSGIAGSMTIPSALTLIVRVFPEPGEQGIAIAIFGTTGAIANILGLIIGALFTQYASWRWLFWFATILALPSIITGVVMIPAQTVTGSELSLATRFKRMDFPGVATLTIAIILFILALTKSSTSGWGSAIVIAPLVIAVVLVVIFFIYERLVPQDRAAVPYNTWFYKNFSVLFGAALVPYFWWVTTIVIIQAYWQEVYHWSIIMAAVRMIPIGVAGTLMSFLTPLLAKHFPVKYILLGGYAGTITGTVLLTLADRPSRYWSYVFPAYVIGSAGTMATFIFGNIGIFRSTPPAIAGTVGAVYNSALQLGSAVGSAAFTSIQLSLQKKSGSQSYDGRRAGFWFVFAVVVVVALGVAVFYDDRVVGGVVQEPKDVEQESSKVEETIPEKESKV
ncbi:major facilitator superfamily domain-containing protein [Flagelloscypha sp. PMI_526]|nr:major facilitator superfamily domain-containing protein [Flagelloscypha sp. PMI_526]